MWDPTLKFIMMSHFKVGITFTLTKMHVYHGYNEECFINVMIRLITLYFPSISILFIDYFLLWGHATLL